MIQGQKITTFAAGGIPRLPRPLRHGVNIPAGAVYCVEPVRELSRFPPRYLHILAVA